MNGLALCAGVGGLELGLHLALGDAYRTVGYVERDSFAAAVLVARMADQALDRAPVWDDLATFNGRPWRGRVDLVSAGFPCQPSSSAGDRRGTTDERWLWPDIERVLAEVEPALVFIENVPGLLTVRGEQCCGVPLRRGTDRSGRCRLCGRVRGVEEPADLAPGGAFAEVLGSLASLGFDAEWDVFSAAEVGASHLRERLFLLAHRDGRALVGREQLPGDREAPRGHDADGRGGARRALADADLGGLGVNGTPAFGGHDRRYDADSGLAHVADPGSGGRREGPGAVPAREPVAGAGVVPLAVSHGQRWERSGDRPGHAARGLTQPDGRGASLGDPDLGYVAVGGRDALAGPLAAPFPPGPADLDRWQDILSERAGLAPAVEPAVRGVADGLAHRVDRLRAAGNGVVSLVVPVAFMALAARAGLMEAAVD